MPLISNLRRFLPPLVTAFLVATPAQAQQQPPARPAETRAQPEEELVVTGRRRELPSFQEEYEFHKAEYERLRQKFDRAEAPRYSPAERKLRAPELLTGTLPGKPTITEKLD